MFNSINIIVQKGLDGTIISQARLLSYQTHLIVQKFQNNITPITIVKQSSSGLLNSLPSLPTNPPTYIN